MKIKDIICLVGAFVFSFLFYQQSWGINFGLYSLFLIAGLAIATPQATKHKNWWLSATAVLFAAVCMGLYGNALCFITLLLAWMFLAGYTVSPQSAAVVVIAQAGISFLSSVPKTIKGWQIAHTRKGDKTGLANHWYIYLLVIGIFLLFVLLYSFASKSFSEVLKKIDLSFISISGILTTLLGYYLCLVFVRHQRINSIDREEKKWAAPLIALLPPYTDEFTNRQQIDRKAGGLLLILLNLLLLIVNLADITFLANGISNPNEHNFSEMVHQGVGALITSIVIAVAILLYLFRGQLNFDRKAKTLFILALLWVLQNLVLIATSGLKNSLYIHFVDGLTYKRIGVFYYLLLSCIGLFFTAYKLYAKKPNWYLVRSNFVVFFGVMVLSCAVNWDTLIARYNIQKAVAEQKDPDMFYIGKLSAANLPLLAQWAEGLKNNPANLHNYNAHQVNQLIDRWEAKTDNFLRNNNNHGWQSWNYTDQQAINKLRNINWKSYYLPDFEIIEQNTPEPRTEPQTETIEEIVETENYRY